MATKLSPQRALAAGCPGLDLLHGGEPPQALMGADQGLEDPSSKHLVPMVVASPLGTRVPKGGDWVAPMEPGAG